MSLIINEKTKTQIENYVTSQSQEWQSQAQNTLTLQCWLTILQWSSPFLRAPITSRFLKL